LLAGLSLAAHGPDAPANGINSYSLEKEAALGRQLASEVERQTTAIHNSTIDDYLKRLGERIAAQMPDAKFPFTSKVITDDPCRRVHEPVALPGGHLFVPSALFVAADDEAEFAGMLAHSMEHIAARHGCEPSLRAESQTTRQSQ
jgi:predicted Zn-dependent protease